MEIQSEPKLSHYGYNVANSVHQIKVATHCHYHNPCSFCILWPFRGELRCWVHIHIALTSSTIALSLAQRPLIFIFITLRFEIIN